MFEKVPCFQFGFNLLNTENSDDFEESSREVACTFSKIDLDSLKVALNFLSKKFL